MSEPELRRECESCVDTLVRRGRDALAERIRLQLDRLIREGQTARAEAVIALFRPTSPSG